MPDVFEIDSVIQSFDSKVILSDVYLKCQTRDVVAILGRNGSGKSTLLKIIFGNQTADHQFIQHNGKKTDRLYRQKNLVAYLPQDNFIPPYFTVGQCLKVFSFPTQSLEFLKASFKGLLDNTVGSLSAGQSRLLEILIILNLKSAMVLLDEPFRGLSPIMTEQVLAYIKAAAKEKCILISDHNYREVLKVSTAVYLLADGKLHVIKQLEDLGR